MCVVHESMRSQSLSASWSPLPARAWPDRLVLVLPQASGVPEGCRDLVAEAAAAVASDFEFCAPWSTLA